MSARAGILRGIPDPFARFPIGFPLAHIPRLTTVAWLATGNAALSRPGHTIGMRVIAGDAKGRRLRTSLRGMRPTTDALKEALFSSLGDQVVGARVLDLYAGSGALGIEALSRRASEAIFVERDRAAIAVIEANLRSTGLDHRAGAVPVSVERFLATPADRPFDIVLVDPPYSHGLPSGVLALLIGGKFLTPRSMVVIETSARSFPAPVPPRYELAAERRYGDSALVYLRTRQG